VKLTSQTFYRKNCQKAHSVSRQSLELNPASDADSNASHTIAQIPRGNDPDRSALVPAYIRHAAHAADVPLLPSGDGIRATGRLLRIWLPAKLPRNLTCALRRVWPRMVPVGLETWLPGYGSRERARRISVSCAHRGIDRSPRRLGASDVAPEDRPHPPSAQDRLSHYCKFLIPCAHTSSRRDPTWY